MSPDAALHSDVFKIYLAILLGMLAVAGAAIGVLGLILKKDVSHAWKSYRSWLVMIPLVLACVFLGRLATIAFFTVLGVFAFKEFARATGLYRDWWMTGAVYLGILGIGVLSAMPDPRLRRARLVRHVRRLAGVRHCADPAGPHPPQPAAGATAGHRPGAAGIHLHRLDVRPHRLPGQLEIRLRLPLLPDFRRGVERRGGLYVWQDLRPASAAKQHQPQEDLGRLAGGAGRFAACCRGCCGFPSRTSRRGTV